MKWTIFILLESITGYNIPTKIPAKYVGCYRDTTDRDLNGIMWNSDDITPSVCIAECKLQGLFLDCLTE